MYFHLLFLFVFVYLILAVQLALKPVRQSPCPFRWPSQPITLAATNWRCPYSPEWNPSLDSACPNSKPAPCLHRHSNPTTASFCSQFITGCSVVVVVVTIYTICWRVDIVCLSDVPVATEDIAPKILHCYNTGKEVSQADLQL